MTADLHADRISDALPPPLTLRKRAKKWDLYSNIYVEANVLSVSPFCRPDQMVRLAIKNLYTLFYYPG